ncbi:hypothetical protein CDS [Bradyrhizobium sp.]|nr:hypothetical protein CDS [Bradyrhizobium sp.]
MDSSLHGVRDGVNDRVGNSLMDHGQILMALECLAGRK